MRTPSIEAPKQFEFSPNTRNGEEVIRETREYELITPLFGGGAETKKSDDVSVIRATEIRGHLRFWWRATRGGQFDGDLAKMKEAEDAIFGSTEGNSALQVDIEIKNRGQDFPDQPDLRGNSQSINNIRSPLSYVAFPLRENENVRVIQQIEFSSQFSYPTRFACDMQASLWAWEMFGGLGARTRRGFGSIQNKIYSPANRDIVEADIQSGLVAHLFGNSWPNDVPQLQVFSAASYKITNPRNSMVDAWKYLIDGYQQFRQFRRPTPSRSRSNWTEPDAIRRLFPSCTHPAHSTPKTLVDKFPRANFGLPIIFKFKDADVARGDPPTTTLEGRDEKQKRLASPLIFRVMKCEKNRYVGIAIILSGIRMPTSGVILKDAPGNPTVQIDLTASEASSVYVNDILIGNPNVLEAFLTTL